MKTKFYMITTAIAAMAMTSCENMGEKNLFDPSKSDEVRQEAYNNAFQKEFGTIPAGQSWDFYAQAVQEAKGNDAKRTRSGGNVEITPIDQPEDMDFDQWQNMLKKEQDNRDTGTRKFSLISNGPFKVYAGWYAGWYEAYGKYKFELGVHYDGEFHKIFGSCEKEQFNDPVYILNPGFGANVDIPKGKSFELYIKYELNNQVYYAFSGAGVSTLTPTPGEPIYSYGNASLWFSDMITPEKQMMVIGFEDNMCMDWTPLGKKVIPDCNDVVLYLEGNPCLPITEAKRFMCEDMVSIGDFDFNDVVLDVRPDVGNKAEITLQAAGGTLPINLYVAGTDLGEVHGLLGVNTKTMVNTGGAVVAPYKTVISVPENFNLTMFNDIKLKVTPENEEPYWITYSGNGASPCFISTPISAKWLKEKVNIKKGYPAFFGMGWYETPVDKFLYK